MPTIREVNQDSIKTYPISRFTNKNVTIPINVFLHTENDETSLRDVVQISGEEFRTRYPEYSGILDRLSQVISYVPVQNADGTYSETEYYAMPDLKFLIPETDIPADCKFIAKGRTQYESAWFGVPTMRYAFLDGHGFYSEPDNPRFPAGNGISTGGIGCSAALFQRDESLEESPGMDENNMPLPVPVLGAAMKRIFEGEIPPEPLPTPKNEDGEDAPDEPSASSNGDEDSENPGIPNYGRVPWIAFDLQRNEEGKDPTQSVSIKKNDKMPQLKAYVHFEFQYESFEYLNYFLDKPLLNLPNAIGRKGYNFEVLKVGGAVLQSYTTPNRICQFPTDNSPDSGLGYIMPDGVNNDYLGVMTYMKRKNLLNNKINSEAILSPKERIFAQGIDDEQQKQIPLRFSANGVFFPLVKSRLTYTNVRNMFYAGNELNISSSEDVSANIFYEPLKYYMEFLGNRTSSIPVFFAMGIFSVDFKYDKAKDPNSFSSVNKEGHADPIRQVVLLENRLIVHTETGLSVIGPQFVALERFADVPITTNLISDSTALIGANKDRVYVAGFEEELGGYTSDDLNKELRQFPYIKEIVDMLDSHRLALFLPKKGNVIYALSQFVDRRFKGFSRFILPITIVKAFRESFDTAVVIDDRSNVYSLNFKTGTMTDFTDHFINEDGETVDTPLISTIRKSNLVSVDAESTTFFSEQSVSRIVIGMSGLPKMGLEYISDGDKRCQILTQQHETPTRPCDTEHLDGVEPLQNPQPFYCYDEPDEEESVIDDASVQRGPEVRVLSTECNTLQWVLSRAVKTFAIDFGRQYIFVGTQEDHVKIFDREDGLPIKSIPEWGDFINDDGKHFPGLVDIKCRTDLLSSIKDYVPYFMQTSTSGFTITGAYYSAEENLIKTREVLSVPLQGAKSFCFMSDNIVAVLVGNSINIYNLKKYRVGFGDKALVKTFTPSIAGTLIRIESMGTNFLLAMTRDGLYRIKPSSGVVLTGDTISFSAIIKRAITHPSGLVSVNNWVFTMNRDDGALHRFLLARPDYSEEPVPDIYTGPTSETEDLPECGITQQRESVNLVGGGVAMLPVPTENDQNRAGAGNLGAIVSQALPSQQEDVNVPVGDGNARLFGVSQNRVGVITVEDDGERLVQYTYIEGTVTPSTSFSESWRLQIEVPDTLATLPIGDNHFLVGSQDGGVYSTERVDTVEYPKPSYANSDEFFPTVDRMTLHYEQGYANRGFINMISGEAFRSFVFDQSVDTPRKYAEFEIDNPSTVVGVIYIKDHYLIVRASGEVNIVDNQGAAAGILPGGVSDFSIERNINSVAYHEGNLWWQTIDGVYKKRAVNITTTTTEQNRVDARFSIDSERNFLTAGGIAKDTVDRYTGQQQPDYYSQGPIFYDKLYQMDEYWNPLETFRYTNRAANFWFGNRYTYMYKLYDNEFSSRNVFKWQRDTQRLEGPPAGPFWQTQFVDETRIEINPLGPFILGQGHFPACIAADEDTLYIPFFEGDICPYNIVDKSYGLNHARGQFDPIKGAKLSYATFVDTAPWRNTKSDIIDSKLNRFNLSSSRYLYNLLMLRAGLAELHSSTNVPNYTTSYSRLFPEDARSTIVPGVPLLSIPEMASGKMGGVSAMNSFVNDANIFTTIYGVSVAYDYNIGWQDTIRTPEGAARASALRTGRALRDQEVHAHFQRPYIIVQTADIRDFKRTHGTGSRNNYRTYDKNLNLVGKNGAVDDGIAVTSKSNFHLGTGTYLPEFKTEEGQQSFPYRFGAYEGKPDYTKNVIYSIEANTNAMTLPDYRADPRYNYRLVSSSRFIRNSRITCVFRDATYVYVIIQPERGRDDALGQPTKGKLLRCRHIDLVNIGLDPTADAYEETTKTILGRTYNLRRAKEKQIPNDAPFEEVTVDTYDYGDMHRDNQHNRVPSWEYFYNIEWDEDNQYFVGVTCFDVYILDPQFRYITHKNILSGIDDLSGVYTKASAGFALGNTVDEKIHAVAISPKTKKIFFLKSKWLTDTQSYFYGRIGASYNIPKDFLFSLRGVYANIETAAGVKNRRAAHNNPAGARIRWFNEGSTPVYGMQVPYVVERNYTLTKESSSDITTKTVVQFGDVVGINLRVAAPPQPEGDILNPISSSVSKAIIHVLSENRQGDVYRGTQAYNENKVLEGTVERESDKEVEVPVGEKPLQVGALDGEVYIAVDDQSSGVDIPQGATGTEEVVTAIPREETVGLPPNTPVYFTAPLTQGQSLPSLHGWGKWYLLPQAYNNARFYDYSLFTRFEREPYPNARRFEVDSRGAYIGYSDKERLTTATSMYPNAIFKER